jgi:hypothetical protein
LTTSFFVLVWGVTLFWRVAALNAWDLAEESDAGTPRANAVPFVGGEPEKLYIFEGGTRESAWDDEDEEGRDRRDRLEVGDDCC